MHDTNDIRFQIAMSRRILAREGCDSGVAGHVSVRVPGEDAFFVSPFEYFDETLPERVIKSSFDLKLLEGDWEPSRAIEFHAELYRARPDVRSIIHTHAHYTSVIATTGRLLGLYNDVSCIFYDDQVLHSDDGTSRPVPGPVLAEAVGPDKNIILIRNHGVIVLAGSLEEATVKAFSFERAARIQVEAEMIGGTEHTPAYGAQIRAGYQRSWMRQMWEASVRRLQRDDAELFLTGDRYASAP